MKTRRMKYLVCLLSNEFHRLILYEFFRFFKFFMCMCLFGLNLRFIVLNFINFTFTFNLFLFPLLALTHKKIILPLNYFCPNIWFFWNQKAQISYNLHLSKFLNFVDFQTFWFFWQSKMLKQIKNQNYCNIKLHDLSPDHILS